MISLKHEKEFPIKDQVFTVNQKVIDQYRETEEKFLFLFYTINSNDIDLSVLDIDTNYKTMKQFEAIENYIDTALTTKQLITMGI
tara:strand:- start:356 stop:610 length:255 start_codon:yes stop_codon:yes gene_type:complete